MKKWSLLILLMSFNLFAVDPTHPELFKEDGKFVAENAQKLMQELLQREQELQMNTITRLAMRVNTAILMALSNKEDEKIDVWIGSLDRYEWILTCQDILFWFEKNQPSLVDQVITLYSSLRL